MTPFTFIDLFAGCGGMTLGFEATGDFKSCFAVECDPDAAETYRRNFGDHVFEGLIQDVENFPSVDVIVGGPPCQGFSPLNMRKVGFERRALWTHYLRALEEAEPRAFVMENVPQLLKSPEYDAFKRAARRLGFEVVEDILNAADFGVAQRRLRAFVVGTRDREFAWPQRTHSESPSSSSTEEAWVTFREAVYDLPLKPCGHNWHRSRNPTALSIERYKTIPREGEGRFELAERRPDITPPCWRRKKTGSTDVFGRLWWDRPAYTIRTEFFKPEKGRYLHPSEHRPITVREAARCMSFSDEFIFLEHQSMTSVSRQIGNAVPPRLASVVAESLSAHLQLEKFACSGTVHC